MASWELAVDVDAPPEAAWALVGDLTSVPRWYPKYPRAEVDGDRRVLHSDDGREVQEVILEHDDGARRYSYSVIAGAPVRSHRAGFAVSARGEGCRITWWTEAEPSDPQADIQGRLTPTQTDALVRMKGIIEGG